MKVKNRNIVWCQFTLTIISSADLCVSKLRRCCRRRHHRHHHTSPTLITMASSRFRNEKFCTVNLWCIFLWPQNDINEEKEEEDEKTEHEKSFGKCAGDSLLSRTREYVSPAICHSSSTAYDSHISTIVQLSGDDPAGILASMCESYRNMAICAYMANVFSTIYGSTQSATFGSWALARSYMSANVTNV